MIKIIQLLCPRRHCLFTHLFDGAASTDAEALDLARLGWDSMKRAGINRSCGICQSRKLTFEIGTTRFSTMSEALPFAQECQRNQLATRLLLEQDRPEVN